MKSDTWKNILNVVIIILILALLVSVILIAIADDKTVAICEYLGYDGGKVRVTERFFEYERFCIEEIPLEQIE